MTLLSVGLGGLVGYGGTLLSDVVGSRDRRLTRWDEARLRAYSEYGAALKTGDAYERSDRVRVGLRTEASPLGLKEGMRRLEEESDNRTMLIEQVLLIGCEETRLPPSMADGCARDPPRTEGQRRGREAEVPGGLATAGQARDQF